MASGMGTVYYLGKVEMSSGLGVFDNSFGSYLSSLGGTVYGSLM